MPQKNRSWSERLQQSGNEWRDECGKQDYCNFESDCSAHAEVDNQIPQGKHRKRGNNQVSRNLLTVFVSFILQTTATLDCTCICVPVVVWILKALQRVEWQQLDYFVCVVWVTVVLKVLSYVLFPFECLEWWTKYWKHFAVIIFSLAFPSKRKRIQ